MLEKDARWGGALTKGCEGRRRIEGGSGRSTDGVQAMDEEEEG